MVIVKNSLQNDKFSQGYNGNLNIRKVERADAGDELQKYEVKGFPTVLLLDGSGGKKNLTVKELFRTYIFCSSLIFTLFPNIINKFINSV